MPPNPECHPIAMVLSHNPALKAGFQRIEELYVPLVLHHYKFRQDLIPPLDPLMGVYTDVKAPLSIYESNYPLCLQIHKSVFFLADYQTYSL